MVEFERIYGDRVNLFGAILGRISRPNKLPLEQFSHRLIGQSVTTVRKPAQCIPLADRIERLTYRFHQGLLRASLNPA